MKILFLFLSLLLSNEIIACSCDIVPLKEEYTEAAAIVIGQVVSRKIEIYHLKVENGKDYAYTYFVYKIRVKKVYKGQPSKTLMVATAREGATCGMRFKLGRTYMVSAFSDERYGLYTNSCLRNIYRKEFKFKSETAAVEELINQHYKDN